MLAGVLKHNTTLLEVNLGATGVGQDGAQALAQAVRSNSTLTALSLTHNPLEESGAAVMEEMGGERASQGRPLVLHM